MFEKVYVHRADRRSSLTTRGISASAAAHLVLAAVVAAVPPRAAVIPPPVEVIAFLVLTSAPRAPVPPPLAPRPAVHTDPPRARGGVPAPSAAPSRSAKSSRSAAPSRSTKPVSGVKAAGIRDETREPFPRAPQPVLALAMAAHRSPAVRLAPAARVPTGIGDEGWSLEASLVPPADSAETDAPVVDAGVLAEQPKMMNRGAIARVLGRLYPSRLLERGVQGSVMATFIIGTGGSVEMQSVEIVSLPHPDFREPTLRGIARMRFSPARLGGAPVRVRATLPIAWTVRDAQ
jgi:TonB family protein